VAEGNEPVEFDESEIAVTARIGVTAAKDLPLRFFLKRQPFVNFVSHLGRQKGHSLFAK
jgi:DNA-3-methyladenine glycosylase